MRISLYGVTVFLVLAGLAGTTRGQPLEVDTDRPGGDYTNVTLPSGSAPQLCLSLCNADAPCQAWTFVKAAVQAQNPRCWLKSSVPAAITNQCCVSGVKSAGAFEPDTDRPGGDYINFDLPPNWVAQACQALCKANVKCKAWTFVKAGFQGSSPRCWMKSTVPAKLPNNCCTSGVK